MVSPVLLLPWSTFKIARLGISELSGVLNDLSQARVFIRRLAYTKS